MTISSVGGTAQSYLSQLYSTQQAQAVSAASPDSLAQDDETSASTADGSSSLTGSATASLDSQTLQALMNLTQQDPSQSADGQQGPDQAQGAQHHRHHHHGGMKPPQGDPSSTTGTSAPVAAADGSAAVSLAA